MNIEKDDKFNKLEKIEHIKNTNYQNKNNEKCILLYGKTYYVESEGK